MIFFSLYSYAALFLIFVLVLAAVILKFFSKYSYKILPGKYIKSKTCKVEHLFYIEQNTKCVLLHHSNKKYLLLVGKNNNLLLDRYEESEKAD